MTPFISVFSGGCHMINNDVALRDMVVMPNGVPLGAKRITMKRFYTNLYVFMLKNSRFIFCSSGHKWEICILDKFLIQCR